MGMKLPKILPLIFFIGCLALSAGEKDRLSDAQKHLIKQAKELIIPEVMFRRVPAPFIVILVGTSYALFSYFTF